MSILDFPPEILVYEILPRLSNAEIGALSQINSYYYQLIQDESFWKSKLSQDYPLYINFKPPNRNYRQYYVYLAQLPRVPLYVNNEMVTHFLQLPLESIDQLSQNYKPQTTDVILYTTAQLKLIALNLEYLHVYFYYNPAYIFIISRDLYNAYLVQANGKLCPKDLILSIPTQYPIYAFLYPALDQPIFFDHCKEIDNPNIDDLINMLYTLHYPLPLYPSVSPTIMRQKLQSPQAFFMDLQKLQYYYTLRTYYKYHQVIEMLVSRLKLIGHYFDLRPLRGIRSPRP